MNRTGKFCHKNKQKRSGFYKFMKKKIKSGVCLLFVMAGLPCLIVALILGIKECPPVRNETDFEDYIAVLTAMQIDWEAPKESIKAQTVIARGNFYLQWEKGEEKQKAEEAAKYLKAKRRIPFFLERFHVFLESAEETRGKVLALNHEVKQIPFYAVGTERSRDGKELLGENFAYLISVDTIQDKKSPSYVNGCYFELKEFRRLIKKEYAGFEIKDAGEIKIKETDRLGYVLEIQAGNQDFQGEEMRELLRLPSSCFIVQTDKEMIRFLCRGVGHGLGLSQWTAGKMAEENKQYQEILNYFFPSLELIEVEMQKNE